MGARNADPPTGAGPPPRLAGGLRAVPRGQAAPPGRSLHGLRHPVLQQRVPARQPDPRLERPRLPRPLAGRDRAPARDEQLPRVHRAALPGAVRGVVRARHQRRSGDDQAGRGRDRRPRLGRGMDHAAGARREDGQARRRGRLRSRRPRRRAATHTRGPRRRRVRARRPHRRSAALRHPRVQDGEAPPRPPARPDARRGHRVPRRDRRRRRRHRGRVARHVRRDRARRWRDRVARPPDPRARARRDPPGHGVPAARQPGAGGRPRRVADHRRRASTS